LEKIPVARAAALGAITVVPALALKAMLPDDFEHGFLGSLLVLSVAGSAFTVGAPALGLFDVRQILRRGRR
jgi:putative peptidoglycan lipid II flippase